MNLRVYSDSKTFVQTHFCIGKYCVARKNSIHSNSGAEAIGRQKSPDFCRWERRSWISRHNMQCKQRKQRKAEEGRGTKLVATAFALVGAQA